MATLMRLYNDGGGAREVSARVNAARNNNATLVRSIVALVQAPPCEVGRLVPASRQTRQVPRQRRQRLALHGELAAP
jgi:hypothetical protein